MNDTRELLRNLFDAAVAAADPMQCVPPHLPAPPKGRTIVIGAGKASAKMARAVEDHWNGPLEGLVVTRYGHAVPCDRIEIVEAAHPVPDAAGEAAAKRILEIAGDAGPDELVLCLISGGGSALLALPAPGLTLADKQAVNTALLRSGATINEMNCVRRHLSAIKGGRLAAAAHPAHLVTLLISDVPGDDPINIASGPTVADPTTRADARKLIAKYGIAVPDTVAAHLERDEAESVKPGDPRLAGTETILIATPKMSLDAAARVAKENGYDPISLGDALEGEARDLGTEMAARAKESATGNILLSGGEVTVTIKGDGIGGPNVEFLLSLAIALDGAPGISAIACDTDGVDGAAEVAGAIVTPDTLARARSIGLEPTDFLARNDAHTFFEKLGDQVVPGPTLTNVNDFRAIVVEKS